MARDILEWLEELGLGQYSDAFVENEIDFDLLVDLADADLEKLGIAALGHRKRLLRAISALGDGGAAVVSTGPAPRATAESPDKAERRHLTELT